MTFADTLADQREIQEKENLLMDDPYYNGEFVQIDKSTVSKEGEFKSAFFAYPDNFHPFSNDPFVSSLWDLCTASLGQRHVCQYEKMSPCLAKSVTKKIEDQKLVFTVTLFDDLYWEDLDFDAFGFDQYERDWTTKQPLSAGDFKLYVDALQNPHVHWPKAVSLRKRYQGLKEIKVINSKVFEVIWEFQDQVSYDASLLTLQLKPLPTHIFFYDEFGKQQFHEAKHLDFADFFNHHWAQNLLFSCGAWILEQKEPQKIVLKKNTYFLHQERTLLNKMIFYYKSSPSSAWQAFKAKELSSCLISPMQLRDFKQYQQKNEDVYIQEFHAKMYYFVGWNLKNPIFDTPKVRKALSLAIHREKIIEHFFKGKAKTISGPFMPTSQAYNKEVNADSFDLSQAKLWLEEEGWQLDPTRGLLVKEKDQKKYTFRFRLAYFASSELATALTQFIASSLKEIGVECVVEPLNYPEFMQRYNLKNFDSIFMAWSLPNPPEDPSLTWHSGESEKIGSSNIVGFKNEKVDCMIDELKRCHSSKRRLELYRAIHKEIHEQSPYAFLVVPTQLFVYRSTLKNVWVPTQNEAFAGANVEEINPKIFYIFDEKK